MPVTGWEEIAGFACAWCGGPATHFYGSATAECAVCCDCHAGKNDGLYGAEEAANQHARILERRNSNVSTTLTKTKKKPDENGAAVPGQMTAEQVALVKSTIFPDSTDDELKLFVMQCNRTGLDPFSRQIHAVKRKGKLTIQVGIDGYRLIADRTGAYAGNDDPVFDDERNPQKATVTVWKVVGGVRCPFSASARWAQYYPGSREGWMWDRMPHLMLGKVAESLALRKAFPAELSGLYVPEEMEQAADERRQDVPATAAERSAAPRAALGPPPAVVIAEEKEEARRYQQWQQQQQQAPAPAERPVPPPGTPPRVFLAGLTGYDSKLAAEGLCRVGDLLKHVSATGKHHGYPADLTTWDEAQIGAAREWSAAFLMDALNRKYDAETARTGVSDHDVLRKLRLGTSHSIAMLTAEQMRYALARLAEMPDRES